MANVKQLAANTTVVSVSTDSGATWTPVKGLNKITLGFKSTGSDVSDFDAIGWTSEVMMSRGATLKLDGHIKTDGAGTRDPGQASLDTLGLSVGAGSVASFKMEIPLPNSSPAKKRTWTFDATVELSDQAGGMNDMLSWGATLTTYGTVAVANV